MPAAWSQRCDAFWAATGLRDAKYVVVTGRRSESLLGSEAVLSFKSEDAPILRLVPRTRLEIAEEMPAETACALLVNWGDARAFLGGTRDRAVQTSQAGGDNTLRDRLAEIEKRLGFALGQVFAQLGAGQAAEPIECRLDGGSQRATSAATGRPSGPRSMRRIALCAPIARGNAASTSSSLPNRAPFRSGRMQAGLHWGACASVGPEAHAAAPVVRLSFTTGSQDS